ncbi:MAG TPA: beta-phosphoglucomutase [Ktedonobacteraceae bacterium]|nr:beta-phosphoglucomutase [Ktedonobacteraceae bacterium]
MQPQAVIFDLDGVLCDTSEYHYQAWKHLADDEGIPFSRAENDQHLRGVGRRESLMFIIRGRQYTENQVQEMMARKNRYYLQLVEQMTPQDLVPGGRELLEQLRSAGIKKAIASGSKNCRLVLDRLGITDLFDGIADGNSITRSKPAPDVFVWAAGRVDVACNACLGIEDANDGIIAIRTAGMRTLGVGPAERFTPLPDKLLPSFAHVNLQDLIF